MLLIRLQMYIGIRLSVFEYVQSTISIENIVNTDKELNAIIKHIINANYGIHDIKSYTTPPMIASSTQKRNSCAGGDKQKFLPQIDLSPLPYSVSDHDGAITMPLRGRTHSNLHARLYEFNLAYILCTMHYLTVWCYVLTSLHPVLSLKKFSEEEEELDHLFIKTCLGDHRESLPISIKQATTHTSTSTGNATPSEQHSAREHVTARPSIHSANATAPLGAAGGDDGGEHPHSKSLQLQSRCQRDDENKDAESPKSLFNIVKIARDLLGLSNDDSQQSKESTRNEPEVPKKLIDLDYSNYEDSLETHITFQLPNGSPAHVSKYTGKILYDNTELQQRSVLNSTEFETTLETRGKAIPNITVTPILENEQVSIPKARADRTAVGASRKRYSSESSAMKYYPSPLTSKLYCRLNNSPFRKGSPKKLRCKSIRISGVHKVGSHEKHIIYYKSNFTILSNLPASMITLKEAERLVSMNSQIIDYRCELLDVKPPGIGGNSLSDLLSSSLVRSYNPIKKMFTEVNKYRVNTIASEDFMNTVGIHYFQGRTERTNVRALMDDVACETDYPVCIVNTGTNVNMVITPTRLAPSVYEGFDIELSTGALVLLEPKLVTDYKVTLPAQGGEDSKTCLLFFFHKPDTTWTKPLSTIEDVMKLSCTCSPEAREANANEGSCTEHPDDASHRNLADMETRAMQECNNLPDNQKLPRCESQNVSDKKLVSGEISDIKNQKLELSTMKNKNLGSVPPDSVTKDGNTNHSSDLPSKENNCEAPTDTDKCNKEENEVKQDVDISSSDAMEDINSLNYERVVETKENTQKANTKFISEELYTDAVNAMTKTTLMKLLKSSKINVSGCVADLRKSLINHLKHCSINQIDVKEDVLRGLVNSLNTKGINSEMKKLGIPIKGKNCVKRELLVNALKNNTYTCSDIPITTDKPSSSKENVSCLPMSESTTNTSKKFEIVESSLLNMQAELSAQKAALELLLSSKGSSSKAGKKSPLRISGDPPSNCGELCEKKWAQLRNELNDARKVIDEMTSKMTVIEDLVASNYKNMFRLRISEEHDYCKPQPYQGVNFNVSLDPAVSIGTSMKCNSENDIGYDSNDVIPDEILHFHQEQTVETSFETAEVNPAHKQAASLNHISKNIPDKPVDANQINATSSRSEPIMPNDPLTSKTATVDRIDNNATNSSEKEWSTVTRRKTPSARRKQKTTPHNKTDEKNSYQQPQRNVNHQHRCALVYDENFDNFRNDFFTRLFDVKKIKIKSVVSASFIPEEKDRKTLSNCDVIYIYVGSKDINEGRSVESVLCGVKRIINMLVKNTKAKICLATPIRSAINNKLEEKLSLLENTLYEVMSQTNEHEKRLSVSNLHSIGSFVQNERLSERGTMRLYLKMKDGLFSSLGYKIKSNLRVTSYRRKTVEASRPHPKQITHRRKINCNDETGK